MIRRCVLFLIQCCFLVLSVSVVSSEALFQDERFQGEFTTDNLDRIIEEYSLFNGWFWTAEGNEIQNFHGHMNCPGWTESSVAIHHLKFRKGWYGCRWGVQRINPEAPSKYGYGECYGFSQFIGYLLSGERNPQHKWPFYYSVEEAGGLKVGDIVRVDYQVDGTDYRHSAVVYAVHGDEITFLQASGSSYNRISVDTGFSDGRVQDVRNLYQIAGLPYLKISRSKLNMDFTGSR